MTDVEHELIGRTLGGRFRLTGFLGEGAMASVFRGEQDVEPRQVAVKVMRPELLRDVTFAKRFTREAKAAARIEHRNTVRILEHGEDGDLLYLAMELCAGQDLFDLLARERRLPEARAARIVSQVCSALTAAHAHGIVHRDLKPENVMIVPDPDAPGADLVKVLDFGIAKILERERSDGPDSSSSGPPSSGPPSSALTMVGALVGTPEYMSPEQSLGLPVDARSDVYACGVLLFYLVTGKQPFSGSSPIDVMMQQADKPPPAPSTFQPGIHAGLERVILKALAKSPAARQQSAAELLQEISTILSELATSSRRTSLAGAPGDTGAALLGVPSAVVIKAPAIDSEPPPPPETMRSPPPPAEAGTPEVIIGATKGGDVARTPIAFEKTLAVTAPEPSAAVAKAAPVVVVAYAPPAALPVEAPVAPPASPQVEAVAAVDPPREERRAPLAAPSSTAPSMDDVWIAPGWVLALAVVIGSALIWLVRYMRFE